MAALEGNVEEDGQHRMFPGKDAALDGVILVSAQ